MKSSLVNTSLLGAAPIAIAVLLGLAAHPANDSVKLRFAPAPGTTLEHEITVQNETEGGDLTVKMGGSDVPSQFLPKLEFSFETSTTVGVTDEFLEGEEGIAGPWRQRTITESKETFGMEFSMDGETTDYNADGSSELNGQAFLIGRDEDGDVVARWADKESSLSTELLESQRPECDLSGLLIEDEVAIGDSWEADAGALANVIDVSRQLPWDWSASDDSAVPDPGDAQWSGDLELTVLDITTEGDQVHCTVSIAGEGVETVTKPGDLSQVPVAEGDATETTETTFQLEGEFTWNVTSGHVVSLSLEADGEGSQVTEKDAGQPGPEYSSTTNHTSKLTIELK